MTTKNKHMTIAARTEIQDCLQKKMTFKAIAKLIGKDPTTISKEIKLHAKPHKNSFVTSDDICPKLMKAPFVCNGCKMKSSSACHYPRMVYIARTAQEEYESTLTESREGIALNKASFYVNDRIISEKVSQGQHIYHITQSSDITVSKSTIYRYFKKGYLSVNITKLPRAVKFKARSAKATEYVPKGVKVGRSYDDFTLYMEETGGSDHQEFDTVIGNPGGKVILTVHFTAPDFMFGLLLENKSAAEMSSRIIAFKEKLSINGFAFGDIFPVILTDNGGEFSNVPAFENDLSGNAETKMFFCDPMCSSQKPYIEKNHTLFRDIIPKGSSFDAFTQETVDLIFSHVNSVRRKQFNGKSSYDMFSFIYSAKLLSLLNIQKIPSDKVVQSPLLQKSSAFIQSLAR